MARLLPVADGVLKHQLYLQAGTGDGTKNNDCVATIWTHKAGGSPVGATRINAEQAAIIAWVNAQARNILFNTWQIVDLRTWDYGLDPATRTRLLFSPIQGALSTSGTIPAIQRSWSYVVALRGQAVGSTTRDRLNGRIAWPVIRLNTVDGAPTPAIASVATVFATLRNTYLTGAGDVGVWSFVSYRAANAIRVTPLVVTVNHVLASRYGHQRRRDFKPSAYAVGS